ncbi:hypothetical protein P3X46_024286 [Hevea brasiliensis]|uniref:C2 domain-containing protein n=1 Tax=Hevea brasiliensis TaxID=3981 RepID=A0ABQ9L352_HEVBR|nr:hypothetical protein P3X46_024286 [Hevea brasiliensis]
MPSIEDSSVKEIKPNIDGGIATSNNELTLVEELNFLYERIVGCSNLPGNKLTGTCDPFIELKIGNYKGTTKCIQNTSNPVWNQVFAFSKDRLQAHTLEIFVRDKAFVNDEIIGLISFAISDVPTRLPWDSPLAPQWYRLEDQNGFIVSGDLILAIWIGNQADDAFSVAWHSDAANVRVESAANTRPKIYYSPRLWYVRVKVIEAQDLVPSDRTRNPEVYVKVVLGNVVLRTKISSNKGANPSWNEELMFVAAEPFEDILVLSVEDKLGDNMEECLGKCVIPLHKLDRRLLPPPVADKWVNLERNVVVDEERKEMKFACKLHLNAFLDGVYNVFDGPAQYSSDLKAASPKLKPEEIGLLELGILKAEGLVPMKSKDGFETTDAYCVAKYGPKWARTSTIADILAPKWHEQYKWEVYDPCTVITIGVFDNCNLLGGGGKRDSIIGKVRIRLPTLETDRIYAHSYPLLALRPDGMKKMGELQLVVRFSCISMVNLLHTYTQPLLPKTQYVSPLSVYQLNTLRRQAVYLICSRLSRTDPPLRKEVVEYILDARARMWSIRKGKANLERVMRCLSVFPAVWIWFDGIRQWKNSVTTQYCLIFSSILLLLVSGRPTHPPNIDTKLSHVEDASSDDWDEEFDAFPSSKPGEIIRKRYDRLRSIAGRLTEKIVHLAAQLEGLYSLLTWRHPRATPMFVVFCLITGLVLYLVPFRWLLAAAGTYAMRPPRLRVTLPPIPQNFLRRMPAKDDSML